MMRQFPKIQWIEDPNREKLRRWFGMRDADLEMRASADAEDAAAVDQIPPPSPTEESSRLHLVESAIPADLIAPFDPDVKVGEIRLLSSRLTPQADRPVYIAVFREWDEDLLLVAPFSPYPLAATRTELEFPDRSPVLRVLCPWNAHTVTPISIADSWLVDVLSEAEMADSWQIFRHAAAGYNVPDELMPRVGCPIRRPSDPRVEYQSEEAAIFELLSLLNEEVDQDELPGDAEAMEALDSAALVDYEVLPLAALSSVPLEVRREEFRIPGLRSSLCVYGDATSGEIILAVYEPDGEPSRQLDFAIVFDSNGGRLATIRNGLAKWKVDASDGQVSIVLPSGQKLRFIKR